MIEHTLDIVTRDGAMETFIGRPERGGPYPAVFLLMDAPGIREELRDMARRLATVGYYVLLPNLYYRAGRDTIYGPSVLEEGSAERERMRAVRTKMTIPPVMDDVAAMLAFVDGQAEARNGAVGCHGYCMSGPYALAAAARYPDRVAAAASFYGTWLVSDAEESPHLSLGKVLLWADPPDHAGARNLDQRSIASGEVIGCGGNARTLRIGTSSLRIWARLAGVHMLGGFVGSGTQRSSPGPSIGLNTAWLVGRKPYRSGQP